MAQKILNESWSDYDTRKILEEKDQRYFSCSEQWEVEFLVQKIKKIYYRQPESTIRAAITACCKADSVGTPRRLFVENVMKRLDKIS